jgi:hypothetical protein
MAPRWHVRFCNEGCAAVKRDELRVGVIWLFLGFSFREGIREQTRGEIVRVSTYRTYLKRPILC